MNAGPAIPGPVAVALPVTRPPDTWWAAAEQALIGGALTAMVVLPLAEIVLRTWFHSSLINTGMWVQHLTLFIGMAGGALAAREGRLLALSTATFLRGAWVDRARWFSQTCAATVSAGLALAGARFVIAERGGGQIFAAGIPLWVVQCVLPLGFGIIALRLLYQSAPIWRGRAIATAVTLALLALFAWPPASPSALVWPGLAVLLVATALGTPIFAAIGGAGLLLFLGADLPIAAMTVEHYRLTVNPALPSIPLFTLAGYLMAEGGASRRLLRVFQALFGAARGGPALAVVMMCAFFTAFTGGSGVTILALGGLLMPILEGAQFSKRNALGLVTGAGSLGILLPPCMPVILYAIIAHVDIRQMFLGGLLPGVLLMAITAAWGTWSGGRNPTAPRHFDLGEARAALWAAKWELLLPVVSLAALFGGWATPVEAAALTAAYAFITEVVIHRDLHLVRDCPRVAAEAGLLVGGILLILGVALGFTNYLIDAQVPDQLAAWAAQNVHSRWLFLLGMNVMLILVGSVMEIYAAIVVVAPLIVPIGVQLGISPVHLGIIFLANMELGFLAPPVGLNLLLASYRLKVPVGEVTRAVFPLLAVMFLGVLFITYFPPLTTLLPGWFQ
jgi:tripartite ATP-independent transporter DctM subunit